MKKEYPVLDKGFIRYLDRFGDELTIVNAARVSFGNQKSSFDEEKDGRLLHYLMQHGHTSPFRHVFFRFHIRAPEFVMRQWYKHVIGCEWSSPAQFPLHGWNEISGRYIAMNDFYIPQSWRKQSLNNKQGSDGLVENQTEQHDLYFTAIQSIQTVYQQLLDNGIAKEQARIILPLSIYTECIWTVSLQALLHFVQLRSDSHAQFEIREYANILHDILLHEFPHCTNL